MLNHRLRRTVLFCDPIALLRRDPGALLDLLFPLELHGRRLAYMPGGGGERERRFLPLWQQMASERDAELEVVDVVTGNPAAAERAIAAANILLIAGGDSTRLLARLRATGLDRAVVDFARRDSFTLAGFSAGAVVLTPSAAPAGTRAARDGPPGLGLVPFDLVPHAERRDKLAVARASAAGRDVRALADHDYIVIEGHD